MLDKRVPSKPSGTVLLLLWTCIHNISAMKDMHVCANFQVLALIVPLSGQHRGNMFDGLVNDVNLPASVWKVTVGEWLFPNIWRDMPQIIPWTNTLLLI